MKRGIGVGDPAAPSLRYDWSSSDGGNVENVPLDRSPVANQMVVESV